MRKAQIAFDITMMYVMSDQNRTLHQMISILYAFLWACQTMSEKQTTASNKSTCQKLIHCMRACVVFIAKPFFMLLLLLLLLFRPLATCLPKQQQKNAVINNALFCKQFDSWKSFSILCIDFFSHSFMRPNALALANFNRIHINKSIRDSFVWVSLRVYIAEIFVDAL